MRLRDVDRMLTDSIALDTETHRIKAGLTAPPLVCASIGWYSAGQVLGELLDETAALKLFVELIERTGPSAPIINGANMPFDLLVLAVALAKHGYDAMPGIYRALMDDQRVFDVQTAEGLDAVAEGCLGKDPRTGGELMNPETGRRGRYSLSMCVDLVLGRQDAKANDEWRQAYAELHPYPIASWPQIARDYPVDDAVNTHQVALAQAGHLPRVGAHRWSANSTCEWCGKSSSETFVNNEVLPCQSMRRSRNMHDLANQVGSAFAMHIGAGWGFVVDQESVDLLEADTISGRDEATVPFVAAGLLKRKKDGTVGRDMSKIAERVALAYGAQANAKCLTCEGTRKVPSPKNPKNKINCKSCAATGLDLSVATNIPTTETGRVGSGRDPLTESGDELLMALAAYSENARVLQTYIPYLRRGRTPIAGHGSACEMLGDEKKKCSCPGPHRDIPLTLWPNVLLETGRTSYGGVIQQFPRKPGHLNVFGKWIPSLRECIVARGNKMTTVDVPDDYILQPGEKVAAC